MAEIQPVAHWNILVLYKVDDHDHGWCVSQHSEGFPFFIGAEGPKSYTVHCWQFLRPGVDFTPCECHQASTTQFGLQRGACKNQLPFCSILVGFACGGVTGEESSQSGTVVFCANTRPWGLWGLWEAVKSWRRWLVLSLSYMGFLDSWKMRQNMAKLFVRRLFQSFKQLGIYGIEPKI